MIIQRYIRNSIQIQAQFHKSSPISTITASLSNGPVAPLPELKMILLPLFLAFSAATLAGATDHIVGAHLGWNPNINYSLWSNNQTFFVNDLISFRYQKNIYNVFEVNQTGYDNCTLSGVAGNWSSGKDFVLLNRSGTYYFICGNGFCLNEMKVSVRVRPLPVNSTSPETAVTGKNGKHGSAAGMVEPSMVVLLGVIAALIGVVTGGI